MPFALPPAPPSRIGRYQVLQELGHGGFGVVYLAHDEQLLRQVAIKVPYERPQEPDSSSGCWLAEAQIVASLDHPHIVPVYDVGSSSEHPAYIVSKFIDGQSLAAVMRSRPPNMHESIEIVLAMAEALHYAHTRGLVHRDVKPGNIMLDRTGTAYLTDFGLALRENQIGNGEGRVLGTAQYMSPEQARGEGHLVDGRADVFSLGVVLYELLVGQRPFQGRSPSDIARAVAIHDPRPPRQRNANIPRELERICLQAMAKRTSERYSTAQDFADDLRQFLAQPSSQLPSHRPGPAAADEAIESPPSHPHPPLSDARSALSSRTMLSVVPKGLRAFDESDSEFFLGLLPGPHDREGMPQSLKFWKLRLEDSPPTNRLRIGVVYGPSGCGKSSLVRAGLVPRLAPSIQTAIVTATATANSTETRLLQELQPFLNRPAKGLIEAMQQLRRGTESDRRLLIVFDQFEQWLHANPVSVESELVQALRQCDGEHLACLLIVRDDFWMSVHRLFREFDIRLAERENCTAVDLFDSRHARRVLHAFGHAYGALPERPEALSSEQQEFLDRVIAELADEDRVICVRLALFAQMVRNRPWIPATLTAIGGASGVGLRFLEDTFGGLSTPLSYRIHQVAIREILRALLPASGTDIKACTRTAIELAAAARCDVNSGEFQQLLDILEEETRLLTPVDTAQGATTDSSSDSRSEMRSYQLTHDYLVPSIREWLTRKQRETWRGRCELRLEDRAALWSARPETKQLPSLWETTQITFGTVAANWSAPQASMMRQAQRMHGRRLVMVGALLIASLFGGWSWQQSIQSARQKQTVATQLERLMVAEIERVPVILQELQATRPLWTDRLQVLADQPDGSLVERLRAELALVARDRSRVGRLIPLLLNADATTTKVARDWLVTTTHLDPAEIWEVALRPEQTPASKLRLSALLAAVDSGSEESWNRLSRDAVQGLLTDAEADIDAWSSLLQPAGAHLTPALSEQFATASPNSARRQVAAQALAQLGNTESLCRSMLDADAAQLPLLLRAVSRNRDAAVDFLRPILAEAPVSPDTAIRLRHVARKRMSGVSLLLLGRDDLVWPLLNATSNSTLRTELILSLSSHGIPLTTLLRGEETVRDPVTRQAIWLAMAGQNHELQTEHVPQIVDRLSKRWAHTEHLAERSAMVWLAERCGPAAKALTESTATRWPSRGKDWFVNSQGQVFAELHGPFEFEMGSPLDEARRDGNESQHRRRIDHSFAVAVLEVTVADFRKFLADYSPDPQVGPSPDCPASSLNWFEAAKYCRWLSEQENIPADQMCYPPIDQIHETMSFPPDLRLRTGYRLLTEAEWEFVCRAGSSSRFFFGEDERHVNQFAWWLGNSQERTWPVGQLLPNVFGLFDIQGNVNEWTQDAFDLYPIDRFVVGPVAAETAIMPGTARTFRGSSYRSAWRMMRSAFRYRFPPTEKISTLGFRLARTTPPVQ